MIAFVMGRGGGKVGVGGMVMELSDSSVRALWHGHLLISSMFALPYWISNRPENGIFYHQTLFNFCRRCWLAKVSCETMACSTIGQRKLEMREP
jgi:hypothetical protein